MADNAKPETPAVGIDLAAGPDETVTWLIQSIDSADDDLLAVFGALAAHGRIKIIPVPDHYFPQQPRPVLSLPQRMHDRLIYLVKERGK